MTDPDFNSRIQRIMDDEMEALDRLAAGDDGLTQRQRETLEWMNLIGKSSVKLARANGFSQEVLDSLVDAGLVRREYIQFAVYRSIEDVERGALGEEPS